MCDFTGRAFVLHANQQHLQISCSSKVNNFFFSLLHCLFCAFALGGCTECTSIRTLIGFFLIALNWLNAHARIHDAENRVWKISETLSKRSHQQCTRSYRFWPSGSCGYIQRNIGQHIYDKRNPLMPGHS